VMKALEKDRTRRYETANGLAMDVQRYLNNEPVIARPPSRLYRFGKLVRRNQIIFAAGALAVTALAGGLGFSTLALLRERAAERRESQLRREAEANSKINQAAIYVSHEKFDEADKLLSEFKTLPPKPSFDGVNAFRSVGEWQARQGRWQDAADSFYPLLEIDKLDDWSVVTLDYQACAGVLAMSGDTARYQKFCQLAVANYGGTTNGDMAGRILKACLLYPPDEELMAQLRQMGDTADKTFAPMPAEKFPDWAAIHLSLWHYRRGDFALANSWRQRVAGKDKGSAIEATTLIVQAMSDFRQNNRDAARAELEHGRALVDGKFQSGLDHGNGVDGYWFDWVFAKVLAREADGLTGKN
jgi:eukaryotic-like serine/threonine-protein kinase